MRESTLTILCERLETETRDLLQASARDQADVTERVVKVLDESTHSDSHVAQSSIS